MALTLGFTSVLSFRWWRIRLPPSSTSIGQYRFAANTFYIWPMHFWKCFLTKWVWYTVWWILIRGLMLTDIIKLWNVHTAQQFWCYALLLLLHFQSENVSLYVAYYRTLSVPSKYGLQS
jgi:hypothetical protein